jgi:hypothetical protein
VENSFRSLLPAALAHGITRPLLWPLMIGAWKRKERA